MSKKDADFTVHPMIKHDKNGFISAPLFNENGVLNITALSQQQQENGILGQITEGLNPFIHSKNDHDDGRMMGNSLVGRLHSNYEVRDDGLCEDLLVGIHDG